MGCFVSGIRQVASDRVLHGILVLLCCRFSLGPWSQSGLFLLLEYEDSRYIFRVGFQRTSPHVSF